MEPLYSFVIAAYYHIDGTVQIEVYDDCTSGVDAILGFLEDEDFHMDTVPDVSNMEYEEAVDTLLAYLEDQDVSAGVHQL
jgi:hypothetical protein